VKFDQLSAVVADDQRTSRGVVTEILRSVGMRDIRHAGDGAEALHLCMARRPSFVLIDLEMSNDGIRSLRQIRRSECHGLRRVPVTMLTAAATRSIVESMRDAGANEIIVKPLTTAKLLGRIQNSLLHTRPFVDCTSYVGPERRRTNSQPYRGPFRRESDGLSDVMEI